jgi:hypothetical protein
MPIGFEIMSLDMLREEGAYSRLGDYKPSAAQAHVAGKFDALCSLAKAAGVIVELDVAQRVKVEPSLTIEGLQARIAILEENAAKKSKKRKNR